MRDIYAIDYAQRYRRQHNNRDDSSVVPEYVGATVEGARRLRSTTRLRTNAVNTIASA